MSAVFGLAGWSGAGKTTLIERLLPALAARGVSVSTIKQTHHQVDFDKPGKDSFRHREAGAREVLVATPLRWALMRELRGAPAPTLDELLGLLSPVDLVLVEGFRAYPYPKIEIHRPALGKPFLWPDDPTILAVASDAPLAGLTLPRLDLDDAAAIAEFILARVFSS